MSAGGVCFYCKKWDCECEQLNKSRLEFIEKTAKEVDEWDLKKKKECFPSYVENIRERKIILEQNIESLLNQFSKETFTTIRELNINSNQYYTNKNKITYHTIYDVEIKVNI